VKELDLQQLASHLWQEANPGILAPKVTITEMSLSANQLKSEKDAYSDKYSWKGEDDAKLIDVKPPADKSKDVISVEP
jgi:hypothetical protein